MSTFAPLNLDQSLPTSDAWRLQNLAGTVRWLSAADPRTIDVMGRVLGDLAWRDNLIQIAINQIQQIITTNPAFTSFDDSVFVRTDGSHPLTDLLPCADVSGNPLTPSSGSHLTPKHYVDAGLSSLGSSIDDIASQVSSLSVSVPHKSTWVSYDWSTGAQSIDLTLTTPVGTLDNIVNVVLMEKVNVGNLVVPNYVYRQLMHGTLGGQNGTGQPGSPAGDGIHVDDCWVVNSSTVRVLLPGISSYSNWPTSTQYNFQAATQRWLRAVIWETT